jgi:hypothetical protein
VSQLCLGFLTAFPDTELSVPGYVRAAIRAREPDGSFVWPVAVVNWPEIVGIGIFDQPTNGRLLYSYPFESTRVVHVCESMILEKRIMKALAELIPHVMP